MVISKISVVLTEKQVQLLLRIYGENLLEGLNITEEELPLVTTSENTPTTVQIKRNIYGVYK